MASFPGTESSDTQAIEKAATVIADAASEEPRLAQSAPRELLRYVPGKRMVLRGEMGGTPAIFRIYANAPDACARNWAELRRIWPLMNDGSAQVCRPLACAPQAGVLVTADVPGTPLLKLLWNSEPSHRAAWLAPAARWLRTYTDCSETDQPATPEGWATRAARAASEQAFTRLRKLERRILAEIERLVPLIEDSRWRVAIGHGDFHPNNLLAGDHPALTGIDCGGSRSFPIYKDMARFLMHMGRRGMIPSGDRFLGVDRAGLTEFSDAFDLTDRERELILPFFLAVEALIRVETRGLSKSRVRHARAMSEALLEDLRSVAR
ncbi:MAG: phosphotransferase [Pseudomonadota bacterium]